MNSKWLAAACVGVAGLFLALGVWQLERRAWKLDLIARVDERVHAAARPFNAAPTWRALRRESDEYRRVSLNGSYLPVPDTYVVALTELGGGYWVLSPLATHNGVVLINRGFVPQETPKPRTAYKPPAGPVNVVGLVRFSEPGGAFLRANAPAADRWYSRDVAAIARARGLGRVAPVFIDAEARGDAQSLPVAGLTVTRFRNAHLAYALTWFGLALGALVGAALFLRPAGRTPEASRAVEPSPPPLG